MLEKFLNYSFIGIINTFIGYLIIFYLTYINIIPEFANITGYCVGFILSFFLNKKYNFKSDRKYRKEVPKFILTVTISYMLNLLVLILLYRILNINIYISQLIASVVYLGAGFLLSYFYIFNYKKL